MTKPYETISCDRTMHVPREVAVCPICDAGFHLAFGEWDLEDDGTWSAMKDGMRLECSAEPASDTEAWDEWQDEHYGWLLDDWLPLKEKVWQWIHASCRFDVPGNEVARRAQAQRLGINW